MSEPLDLDALVTMQVRVTLRQLREINRRAGLGAFDGRARGVFVAGTALGEPHAELLKRVHEIRDDDVRARRLGAEPMMSSGAGRRVR